MGNNKVYRQLTSVKTDANFLIFNLGNDASRCRFLSLPVRPKNQPLVNGQQQGCTTFFKTIVTVLVAMCALSILSAIKAIDISVEILKYMEPELSA